MTSGNKKIKALQESMSSFEQDTGLMRSHKFQVILLPNNPADPRRIVDFMTISGLALSATPKSILARNPVVVMSRAFRPGDRILTDWLNSQEEISHVLISAGSNQEGVTFRLHGAVPTQINYSDLDAGSNTLFIEQVTLEVRKITAEHKLFSY